MAKLADAADLKSAGRKAVGVQVPLRAPRKQKTYVKQGLPIRVAIFCLVAVLVAVGFYRMAARRFGLF